MPDIRRTFYRGDSLPSIANNEADPRSRISTWINTFKTDGMLTKAFRCSDGSIFDRVLENLPYYVAAHVGYEQQTPEMDFSKKRSTFISWSECTNLALEFVDRTGKKNFKDCRVFDATHFLFELEVTLSEDDAKKLLPQWRPGLYLFSYDWSFDNFQHILDEEVHRLLTGDHTAAGSAILMDAVKKANSDNPRAGKGILIDVVTFLRNCPTNEVDQKLCKSAIEKASLQKEWLLFPIEGSESVRGISGRFSPNKCLKILKWICEAQSKG